MYWILITEDQIDVVITVNFRIKDYERKKIRGVTVNSIDIDC